MLVVMFISVLGALLVQVQAARTRLQVAEVDKVRSFYLAEAGLSEAFLAVSEGMTGNIGSQSEPAAFGDGIYWVEAADHPDGQVVLVSNALCGVGRFSIAIVLQREVNPVGSLGTFGGEQVQIGTGAILDGYDSRLGDFESQLNEELPSSTTGEGAQVRSNGEISLEYVPSLSPAGPGGPGGALGGASLVAATPHTTVYGDAQPGPASSVILDPGAIVTGSSSPASAYSELPAIDVPVIPATIGLATSPITGARAYDTLVVSGGSTLAIQGPATLVVGSFVLEPNATLVFDTSEGPIKVYCTDYLSFGAGSNLSSCVADPTACALLVTASDTEDHTGDGAADPGIVLESEGQFQGLIYAPNAALAVPKSLRVFGSIAALDLMVEDGAHLSFDQALAYEGSTIDGLPAFIAWHVVVLPDTPLVSIRTDPLEMLRVNGLSTVPSADAHIERTLDVTYSDLSGTLQTFSGLPQDLDWSTVDRVLDRTWYDVNGIEVDPYLWLRDSLNKKIRTAASILGGGP
jgi:hypothetical protein